MSYILELNGFDLKNKSEIKKINKEIIFKFGLSLKLFLIIFFLPEIYKTWFLPFMLNGINENLFNPWTSHLALSGSKIAFPYGITMYLAYLPGTLIGNFLDLVFSQTIFHKIGFGLTSLFFDYGTLILLARITHKYSTKLLLITYWCCPISIYTLYFHGQLDILPVFLLLNSIYFLGERKIVLSSLTIALAISAKLSMLIALPFIFVYINRNQRLEKDLQTFISYLTILLGLLIIPFLRFNEYKEMVFQSPELEKIYSVYINYGADIKLFLLPTIFITIIYFIWRLNRITFEMFIMSVGLGFFILILLLPPSPGWFLWILPFLVFYQLRCPSDYIIISLPLYLTYLVFYFLYSSGASTELINYDGNYLKEQLNYIAQDPKLYSLLFTALQCSGLLICIRMYIFGIGRNNFYKRDFKPILLAVAGIPGSGKNNLTNSLFRILGKKYSIEVKENNYKKWNKDHPMTIAKSRLNPNSYDLSGMTQDIFQIAKINENNSRNLINSIDSVKNLRKVKNIDFLLINGSHSLYIKRLRDRIDLKIFLEIDKRIEDYFYIFKASYKNTEFLELSKKEISEKKQYIDIQRNYCDLYFKIIPVTSNKEIRYEKIKPKLKLNIIMSNGYFHEQLSHSLIALCGAHVDIEELDNLNKVSLYIEGEILEEDIEQIASILIPNLEDLLCSCPKWLSGVEGLIQLITIKHLTDNLLINK